MAQLILETATSIYVENSKGTTLLQVSGVINTDEHQRQFIKFTDKAKAWREVGNCQDYTYYFVPNNMEITKHINLYQMVSVDFFAKSIDILSGQFINSVNRLTSQNKMSAGSFMLRGSILLGAGVLSETNALDYYVFEPLASDDWKERQKGLIRSALLLNYPDDSLYDYGFADTLMSADGEYDFANFDDVEDWDDEAIAFLQKKAYSHGGHPREDGPDKDHIQVGQTIFDAKVLK